MYKYDQNGNKVPIVETYTNVRENFGLGKTVERYETSKILTWVGIGVAVLVVIVLAVLAYRKIQSKKSMDAGFGCGLADSSSSSASMAGGKYGFRFY